MAVSLDELNKAVLSLEEAIGLYTGASANDVIAKKAFRDACIQRFEYSIELSWKTAMKVLGSATAAAKPAIREMARNGLILNPEIWMTFIEARNESSHSYDEEVAARVFRKIQEFHPEARLLIDKLNRLA